MAHGLVPAGSEAQIDYGKLGMWFDPVSGRRVEVWAYVMVLAHSRHLFVQPVLKIHQYSWCASHVAAFKFFGGFRQAHPGQPEDRCHPTGSV